VSLGELPWGELTKALVTAVLAGFAAYGAGRMIIVRGSLKSDLLSLSAITLVWSAAVALGLWVTRSSLLHDLRRRKAAAPVTPPEPVIDHATGELEP
jgi:hypothetical protein